MSIYHHLHLKLPSQTQPSFSQSLLLRPQNTLGSHFLFQSLSPKLNRFLLPLCRSSKWDPNAESFINKSFNFSSTKNQTTKRKYFDEGDEYAEDDKLKREDVWASLLEEYIDSIWILEVFNSYGWSLPIIILSILLASGLKAFLMALALPLAQSTIWFLLQKIWDSTQYKYRDKMKSTRKSRVRRGSTAFTTKMDTKEKRVYPSRVQGKDVPADNWGDDGDSSFRGWDELDWGRDFTTGSPKSEQRTSISQGRQSKDNFTRLERRSDTPLLLRLLVSLFPFLNWWI